MSGLVLTSMSAGAMMTAKADEQLQGAAARAADRHEELRPERRAGALHGDVRQREAHAAHGGRDRHRPVGRRHDPLQGRGRARLQGALRQPRRLRLRHPDSADRARAGPLRPDRRGSFAARRTARGDQAGPLHRDGSTRSRADADGDAAPGRAAPGRTGAARAGLRRSEQHGRRPAGRRAHRRRS